MEKYLYGDLNELEEKHWWHISKRKACFRILSSLKSKNHLKILDVGCGTGANLKLFCSLGKTFGIDNSDEAIRYCQTKKIKNVKKGSAYKIPFPSSYFDAVTILDVLEHTEDSKALKEISRVLKKRGTLLITIPAFNFLWSEWDNVLHHKKRYTKKSLSNVLSQNGFTVNKISYQYSFLLIPIFIIRKLKTIFRNKKIPYSSDFKISTPILNLICLNLANMERRVSSFINIPFGTSIICFAFKNEKF